MDVSAYFLKSDKELLFLGCFNLKFIVEALREELKVYENKVKKQEEKKKFFDKISIEEFKEEASKYENPYPNGVFRPYSVVGYEADTLLEEHEKMMRSIGKTNFNICGCCDNAITIEHEVNGEKKPYRTLCQCSFLPESGITKYEHKCLIDSEEKLRRCSEVLAQDIEALKKDKKDLESQIKRIEALIPLAEKKPCLLEFRPKDWFAEGDEVFFFYNGSEYYDVPGAVGKIHRGLVTKTYGYHIEVKSNDKLYNGSKGDGRTIALSAHKPFIVRADEFQGLKDPQFFEIWMPKSNLDERYDKMTKAILS